MIRSFKCHDTESLFRGARVARFNAFERSALRKLYMLHAATHKKDLLMPPGNCFEELKGDKKGRCSIRINDKWRICFSWSTGNADDVEIVDYH